MVKIDSSESHFRLSEDQEHRIYQVRKALECISSLAGECRGGFFPAIESEQVSCLLSVLADTLPKTKNMESVMRCAEEKPFAHPANDTEGQEGGACDKELWDER